MKNITPSDEDTADHTGHKCIVSKPCKDAKEFLNQVRITNEESWGDELDPQWLFRGQMDASWRLRPPAWRKSGRKRLHKIREFFFHAISTVNEGRHSKLSGREIETASEVCAQLCVIFDFAAFCNDGGLYLPPIQLSDGDPRNYITDIAKGHSVDSGVFFEETAAFAQHHGVPTPLLDWSRDPLVAAYFASEPPSNPSSCRGEYVAVWAVNIPALRCIIERDKIEEIKMQHYNFQYLHAQDAAFTYYRDGIDERCSDEHMYWPALEDVVERKMKGSLKPPFVKLTLENKHADELSRLLFKEKKHLATVMPGYDSAASTAMRKWEIGKNLFHFGI